MYICYGINNGVYNPYWPMDSDDGRWLWCAPPGCGIAVKEKDDLILAYPEFDSTKSMLVKITLKHKGSDTSLIELFQNSCLLHGQPELVWGEWRD